MKRTLLLIGAEILIAAVGGYGLRQGINRANQALEQMVSTDKRKAEALEEIAMDTMRKHYDHLKLDGVPEKRRKLTPREDKFLSEHLSQCMATAYIGYDNQLHPDYCRP